MDGRETWTRVVVHLGRADLELVSDRLWAHGPAAIEERADPDGPVLLAGYRDPAGASAAASAVVPLGVGEVQVVVVDDHGLDGWRPWARVERAGRFVIVPPWLEAPKLGPDEVLIRVDPAHTFGSGSHPTTRLVLGRLGELVGPATTVLDVGCGSGILAVGAVLAGAPSAMGIDPDPGAPAATAANAAANGVGDRVSATTRPLADLVADGYRFDVVAANLLAPVVVELANHLTEATSPGGVLVVSGLLADRWRDAVAHLVRLTVTDVVAEDGWVAVSLRRPRP